MLVVKGRFIGLNEYTLASRSNRFQSAKIKKQQEALVIKAIREQKIQPMPNDKFPLIAHFVWYEKDLRRDIDNIIFAKKFIFDALVQEKIIPDDNRKIIIGCSDIVRVDKNNPRVEIYFLEERKEL